MGEREGRQKMNGYRGQNTAFLGCLVRLHCYQNMATLSQCLNIKFQNKNYINNLLCSSWWLSWIFLSGPQLPPIHTCDKEVTKFCHQRKTNDKAKFCQSYVVTSWGVDKQETFPKRVANIIGTCDFIITFPTNQN